jgi:hypothetical protein
MKTDPIELNASVLKTLTAVEADPNSSNQHEINGIAGLKKIFGGVKFTREAMFSVRGQNVKCVTDVTWYEARGSNPLRTEYRLYFKTNPVMTLASPGDSLLIGLDKSNKINVVLLKI